MEAAGGRLLAGLGRSEPVEVEPPRPLPFPGLHQEELGSLLVVRPLRLSHPPPRRELRRRGNRAQR